MTKIKMTSKEFDAYVNEGNVCLSDACEVNLTIEWESDYGRYWMSYNTLEEWEQAFVDHELRQNIWVISYRTRTAILAKQKAEKARKLREMKSLGGQFPVLQNLLIASRSL